jgi:hypothetical protein
MALPLVLTALEIDLQPALGLTDGRVRRALRVSRDRMLAEPLWLLQDRGQEALTQALGRLARDNGFGALLTPSAARPRGTNVVIRCESRPCVFLAFLLLLRDDERPDSGRDRLQRVARRLARGVIRPWRGERSGLDEAGRGRPADP